MKNTSNFTQWDTPSRSFTGHLIAALEGIGQYNYQMIIKHLPNEQHQNPMKVPSSALNDPFAWKCTSQFHRSPEEIQDVLKRAINDTERDLLQNWTWIFGEPEAIEIYKNDRRITPSLLKGMGTCSQVRISDLIEYLKETGEEYRAKLWGEGSYFNSGIWEPIGEYWEPAQGMTYAVYFNKNTGNLTTDQLKEILDESVKQIYCE